MASYRQSGCHLSRRNLFFVSVVFIIVIAGAAIVYDKEKASADISSALTISEDTTWYAGDEHIYNRTVIIENGAVLHIEAGATVRLGMNGTGDIAQLMVLDGSLVAEGTEERPIIFDRVTETDYYQVLLDANYTYPEKTSVLRFVSFKHGGWVDPGGGSTAWIPLSKLVNTARADFQGAATMEYYFGSYQIEHSSFEGSRSVDIMIGNLYRYDYGDGVGNFLSVHNSRFEPGRLAVTVSNASCQDEARGCNVAANFINNWWGDSSGPKHVTNPSGLGGEVENTLPVEPWLTADPNALCTERCFSNILFFPGLEASRLYTDGVFGTEDQLWEPNNESDAEQLFLDENGKSKLSGVYTRDVLDEKNVLPVGQGNIYKSFLHDLDQWKSDGLIQDYSAVPYDWRLSFDDLLTGGEKRGDTISYTGSSSSEYIISELRRLAVGSRSGKVTIVAHSNGGLLTKALVRKIGDEEAKKLIDTIVFVAVPQNGTPQAIGALLHGYDQGLPFDWLSGILSVRAARTLAQNMPGVYPLLPFEKYFSGEGTEVETPVIEFNDNGDATNKLIEKYGYKIDNATKLETFLLDGEEKVEPDSNALASPSTINTGLLTYGKNIHAALDDMVIPESIKVYQIAGFGEETLGTVRYKTEKVCLIATNDGSCVQSDSRLMFTPDQMIDGDGTVVASSALAMSSSLPNVKRYWVDLAGYDSRLRLERKHADILEIGQLRDFIKDNIITGSSVTLPDYISDSEPSTASEKRLRYYLHSPLTLSVKDSEDHKVSASVSDIPGARYKRFGEVQYISLPASIHPTVLLDGEAKGSFALEVQEVEGDVILASTTFTGIPSLADTKVEMDFPRGTIEGAGPLVIDYDGDGAKDHELFPVLNGTVTLEQAADTSSPVTNISIAGILGADGWYTSDVSITLTAIDNENGSGIEKTEYSLDNGTTWNMYTDSFVISTEGTATLQYRSTDKAGNSEEIKTKGVKIDKIASEARISFNKDTRTLEITGMDNLSDVSVITIDKPEMNFSNRRIERIKGWFSRWHEKYKRNLPDMLVTLTDEAGHITDLAFEKTEDRNGFSSVRLLSLWYDGDETAIDDTIAQYRWKVGRRGEYQMFVSGMRAEGNRLESHYIPRKNETWIMEKTEALKDDGLDEENDQENEYRSVKTKLPGMVIPYLESSRGMVEVKY